MENYQFGKVVEEDEEESMYENIMFPPRRKTRVKSSPFNSWKDDTKQFSIERSTFSTPSSPRKRRRRKAEVSNKQLKRCNSWSEKLTAEKMKKEMEMKKSGENEIDPRRERVLVGKMKVMESDRDQVKTNFDKLQIRVYEQLIKIEELQSKNMEYTFENSEMQIRIELLEREVKSGHTELEGAMSNFQNQLDANKKLRKRYNDMRELFFRKRERKEIIYERRRAASIVCHHVKEAQELLSERIAKYRRHSTIPSGLSKLFAPLKSPGENVEILPSPQKPLKRTRSKSEDRETEKLNEEDEEITKSEERVEITEERVEICEDDYADYACDVLHESDSDDDFVSSYQAPMCPLRSIESSPRKVRRARRPIIAEVFHKKQQEYTKKRRMVRGCSESDLRKLANLSRCVKMINENEGLQDFLENDAEENHEDFGIQKPVVTRRMLLEKIERLKSEKDGLLQSHQMLLISMRSMIKVKTDKVVVRKTIKSMFKKKVETFFPCNAVIVANTILLFKDEIYFERIACISLFEGEFKCCMLTNEICFTVGGIEWSLITKSRKDWKEWVQYIGDLFEKNRQLKKLKKKKKGVIDSLDSYLGLDSCCV